MTPLTGTGPRAARLVARERLERHDVSTLSDAELLTILAGPNGSRAADAVLDDCGAVQALPQESAGDLARIDGVTPRTAAIITAAVELGRRTPESPQSGAPGPRRLRGRDGPAARLGVPTGLGAGQDETDGASRPSTTTPRTQRTARIREGAADRSRRPGVAVGADHGIVIVDPYTPFLRGSVSVSPKGTVSFECRLTTPRTTPPSRPS